MWLVWLPVFVVQLDPLWAKTYLVYHADNETLLLNLV